MKTFLLIQKEGKKMLKSVLCKSFLALTCISAANANASGFLFESDATARATYNDNIYYTPIKDEKESVWVFMVSPKAKLSHEAGKWKSSINGSVTETTYSNSLQNQFDSRLGLGTQYDDSSHSYKISADYDVHSNRTEDSDDLGVSIDQIETKTLTLSPSYTHQLSERASFTLGYNYSDVSHESSSSAGLLPYETKSLTGSFGSKLSQRSKLDATLSATDYESGNNSSEFEMLNSNVELTHQLTSLISTKVSAGFNKRDFINRTFLPSVVEEKSSSTGSVYATTVDAGWVTVMASRDNVSNSYGGLSQIQKVNAKFRLQVTPLLGLTFTLDREKIDELNENVADNSRVNTSAIPALILTLAHNIKVRASWTHIQQEYDTVSRVGKARMNRVYVSIAYNFPSI